MLLLILIVIVIYRRKTAAGRSGAQVTREGGVTYQNFGLTEMGEAMAEEGADVTLPAQL